MTCHKSRRPAIFSESSKTIRGQNLKIESQTRVSNKTVFFCPAGQRDRSLFIVPRQRDNGTTSKSCHGTGRDGILTFFHRTGRDGILTACSFPSWNITGQPGDRREKRFKKLQIFEKKNLPFLTFFDNQIVVLSRDFYCCSCPETKGQWDKEDFLSQDKGIFGLMCVQVRDFCLSRGPSTVPLMRILRNLSFQIPKFAYGGDPL